MLGNTLIIKPQKALFIVALSNVLLLFAVTCYLNGKENRLKEFYIPVQAKEQYISGLNCRFDYQEEHFAADTTCLEGKAIFLFENKFSYFNPLGSLYNYLVFDVFVFTIILSIAVLAGFYYYITAERSFFYYLGYLIILLLNLSRSLRFDFDTTLVYWRMPNPYPAERMFYYSVMFSYLLFLYLFTDVGQTRDKKLITVYNYLSISFVFLIALEALGVLGMGRNFNFVEHFLFAPILIGMVLYYIYLLYNDTSENIIHYVLLGSFFAAIGILIAMPIAVAWDYPNTHTGGVSNLAKLSYYKIGVVLEIICFTIGLIKRAKNEQDKLRNAKMETLKLGNEQSKFQLKLLWSQLHSHVLYNFLTHAKAEIQQKNFETAKNYIEEFSHFLREVLRMSRSQVVSIQKELSFCKYYLSLEKRRLDNKFEYKVYCEVSEDLLFYLKIPPFSIQPFLENAIKHGIRKNGMIIVSAFRRGNRLICRVEDNGVGRNASKAMQKGMIDNHMSVGIEIIRERLNLSGINMRIIDLTNEEGNPKGTAVELIFNLDENEL